MKKVLVFGSGKYFEQKRDAINGEIIGFVDNIKNGEIEGIKIYQEVLSVIPLQLEPEGIVYPGWGRGSRRTGKNKLLRKKCKACLGYTGNLHFFT